MLTHGNLICIGPTPQRTVYSCSVGVLAASMTSASEMTSRLRELVVTIRGGVEELERVGPADRVAAEHMCGKLDGQIVRLKAGVRDLETQVPRESKERRTLARKKAEQLAQESFSLEKSYQKFRGEMQRRTEQQRERDNLFNDDNAAVRNDIDHLAAASASMDRSGSMLDELLESGSNILGNLNGQGRRMKVERRTERVGERSAAGE